MIDILIFILINFICGAVVMIWHELPKSVAAHFLTLPIFRSKEMELPSPLKYIDPIGLLLFTFSPYGVGWQKPYEHSPNRLREKEKSLLHLVAVGQLASLLLLLFMIPLYRFFMLSGASYYLIYATNKLIIFNAVIVVVNLLPVPPLDMSKLIHALSPNTYFRLMQNERYIHSAFILLVAFGIIESFVGQIIQPILQLFF